LVLQFRKVEDIGEYYKIKQNLMQ